MNPKTELEPKILQDKQENAVRRLLSARASLVVAVAFAFFAARMFRLISKYAVNIFFSDQWDFNDATLFQKHTIWQMFAWQHGPHRQGLGALFSKLVEPHFGWNSRIESFLTGGIIVAAAICALWLRRRLGGTLSFSDLMIPAVFFTPAQWETLVGTPNFAHGPFPLLLIVLYCLAWTSRRKDVKYPLVLLINFLTIYTGFGLFLGLLTPILLVFDNRLSPPGSRLARPWFASCLLVSLASLGSFFIDYRFHADLACFSLRPTSSGSYAGFIGLMFANFFAIKGTGPLPRTTGIIILVVLVASLATAVWHLLRGQALNMPLPDQKRLLITTALIAYCLLFCINAAYGRSCAGWLAARSSRYAIYLELGMLGFYFHLLGIRRDRTRKWLLAALLASVLLASLHVDRHSMEVMREVKQTWKACYFQTEDVKKCDHAAGFPLFGGAPEGTHLQQKLQYLKNTRQNLYLDSK
jgi:hypothetical protein